MTENEEKLAELSKQITLYIDPKNKKCLTFDFKHNKDNFP